MGLLLDTNIISTHLKRPGSTFSKFNQYSGQLYTAQIVVAELYVWCAQAANSHGRRMRVDDLLKQVKPIAFDNDCAWKYAEIRVRCGAHDLADLMIAATALVHNHVVVSHDRHFNDIASKVADLQVVDWLDAMI